jgi:cytosine/creatinine deaminase
VDLILRNARLQDGSLTDIAVQDGVIAAMQPQLEGKTKLELDASGRLTIPAFVNGHLHACKSDWREALLKLYPNFDFTNTGARFAAIAEVKRQYTAEDVLARADATVKLAVRHGTCALRLFADVDDDAGLRALEGLLRLKQKYAGILEIQVAAFPQNGVFTSQQSTTELLTQALEMGADVVGGIPWLEPTEDAQRAHIDLVLNFAKQFGKPAHFVLDDTDDITSRTAEIVAARTIELGLEGTVCGTQANALAYYDDAHAERVIRLFKRACMTIFSNAHVALVTAPQRHQPAPRGHTRILELIRAGVPVATAQDDINNPYYPFGRNDLLEVAGFMAHLAPLAWGDAVNQTLEMVTTTPARAIGLQGYGFDVGSKANLLVLDAPNWYEAVKGQVEKSFVIVGGRLVSRAERVVEMALA